MPAAHDNIALMKKYVRRCKLRTYESVATRIAWLAADHFAKKYPDKMEMYIRTGEVHPEYPHWEWSKGDKEDVVKVAVQYFRDLTKGGVYPLVIVIEEGIYDIITKPQQFAEFVRNLDPRHVYYEPPVVRWFFNHYL